MVEYARKYSQICQKRGYFSGGFFFIAVEWRFWEGVEQVGGGGGGEE